jgi:Fe-S-cluster containining protein
MIESENKASIDPIKYGPNSKFKFECHKDVKCFTRCCRAINIALTPYDIIRLKNRLGLSAEEFLALYTEPQLLEKTDLPVVILKMMEDEEKSCPFVRSDGCIIYTDRPSACRYYPLGVATLSHKAGADDDDFYFFVNEPHCLGFKEDKEWTIREWREDQGVDIRDEMNMDWTDLMVLKRSFPPSIKLTDQAKQMFFIASYNIEKFRKFVFESSFLERYYIDDETLEKIRNDEIELLRFGLKWLKSILFKDEKHDIMQMRENAANIRKPSEQSE